jgi:2-hydroxy-3-oxopropionate reductase
MAKLGFIGLGRMGSAIVERLQGAGHELVVWNRSADKMRPAIASGAVAAASPREIAEQAETILIILADAPAVEAVFAGPDGILAASRPGLLLIEMSTIAPSVSRKLADQARARGVAMLDAPVSGNPGVVRAGKVGLTIGGDAAMLQRVRPILANFATTIIHAGGNGQGAALKLVNNLALAIALEATAEAMILARAAGLDPRQLVEIAATGGAQMRQMETRGVKMINRDFSPSFTIDGLDKDLSSALDLAAELGAVLPAGSVVRDLLRKGSDQGNGALDPASIVTVLERMAGMG